MSEQYEAERELYLEIQLSQVTDLMTQVQNKFASIACDVNAGTIYAGDFESAALVPQLPSQKF